MVVSRTLTQLDWKTARLATLGLEDEVAALKRQSGTDILVGSPGLIASLTQLGLVDEYQLCVHPLLAGSGLILFKDLVGPIPLQLTRTKTFASGVVLLCYERGRADAG